MLVLYFSSNFILAACLLHPSIFEQQQQQQQQQTSQKKSHIYYWAKISSYVFNILFQNRENKIKGNEKMVNCTNPKRRENKVTGLKKATISEI